MRKLWVIGLLACSLDLVPYRAFGAPCGDLNNDGHRSVADVVLLFRAVLENPDPPNLCGTGTALDCGDINGDRAISISDVVLLFSDVLGVETLFPICTTPPPPLDCLTGTISVSGSITAPETWPTGCTVFLEGQVFVEPGVVLTIQRGVTVKGRKNPSSPPSSLIFLRDSKINAIGTPSQPIVMTSDQAPGTRAAGD